MTHTSKTGTVRRRDDPDTLSVSGAVATPQLVPRFPGPIDALLVAADPAGDHATVHSGDGLFRASVPLATLRDASLSDSGRLIIRDSPTKCWLVKDVRVIDVTHGRQPDSLPPEERAKT